MSFVTSCPRDLIVFYLKITSCCPVRSYFHYSSCQKGLNPDGNPECQRHFYMHVYDQSINQSINLPPSVPIIPTFLYAMEHPSPEPQTTQSSLLPRPSHSAPVLDTKSEQSSRSPPPTFPPLVSLFDNTTFSLQEIQTEPTPDPEPTDQTGLTDLQINQTTDPAVGGG